MGLMSGTSFDGVDGVIFDIENKSVCRHYFKPYCQTLNQICREFVKKEKFSFDELNELTHFVSEHYQAVIEQLLKNYPEAIEVIGVHGQTVKHVPTGKLPYTVQLINASALAIQTTIPIAYDFRQNDMALGGQGAPLAPIFHEYLFNLDPKTAVLNLGGIANISYIDEQGKLRGFDTGPGNALMDAWIFKHKGVSFDDKGQWAASGEIDNILLTQLLHHPYFSQHVPKSLDKETFSLKWVLDVTQNTPIPPENIQATLLAFTTQSIIRAILQVVPECQKLIVCGGGAKNDYLIKTLSKDISDVVISDHLGFDNDKIEAMLIAWLAHKRLKHEAVDLTTVTGANRQTILGVIAQP